MPKKIIFLLSLLLLVPAVMMTGCSEDQDSPLLTSQVGTDDFENLDFYLPYGGLTVSDENEAFDDETLKAMMYTEDDEQYADEIASDPEVQELEDEGNQPGNPNDPERPHFTFLRLRWGMVSGPGDSLSLPEPPCDLLDWTGEVHTDRGIVIVRRRLAFERPADHLIFPRLDRKTVAFVSHTACGFDGLLLQIIERPQDYNPENTEPNRLHINTGPFQGDYEVASLAGLNEINEVDDQGNLMQLNGFQLSDVDYCPKGFLSGRFRHLPEDGGVPLLGDEEPGTQVGTMAGLYMGLTGRISGFLRGGYGYDSQGNRVFVGKYIDRRGSFRGLLTGSWQPAADNRDLAEFEGHWVSASGAREGLLGGAAHSVDGYPGGFFEGRWTTICDDEAEGQVQ